MTIVPSIGSDYGPAGAWCWVQNESETGKLLRFLCFYVPLWAAISFNAAIYIQVIRMLRNASTVRGGWGGRLGAGEGEILELSMFGFWFLVLFWFSFSAPVVFIFYFEVLFRISFRILPLVFNYFHSFLFAMRKTSLSLFHFYSPPPPYPPLTSFLPLSLTC